MSLTQVTITPAEFDLVYNHIVSYMPRYQNMHLREACQRNNRRDLRYLHAMHAPTGSKKVIDGIISGPGVFWNYQS